MYLDEMEDLVKSVKLGESGNACIINGSGQVLFSTYESGVLAAAEASDDLRNSSDAQLSELVTKAADGGSGVMTLNIEGVPSYASYAPMDTVGWSMLVFLTRDAVEAPTKKLLESVDSLTEQASREASNHIKNAVFLLMGLSAAAVAVALVASYALSRRIVKPIRRLTEAVSGIEGDNLDFKWDLDTGDETQMLANSFGSMTERMKNYISDIESMLPTIFPPYPNRSEFDIYAVMDPAREVGGDFYDFFLIDEDHLGLVIADVSGKGVPAALFMMASKIMLQSYANMGLSPSEILKRANDAICSNNEEQMFVTVWVGVLELSSGRLTAANAGHEYPAIKKPGGAFELFRDPHGLVVGAMAGVPYREYEITMEPGSKLFVYTDGLPEAMGGADGRDMLGTERMLEMLNSAKEAAPEGLLEHIRTSLGGFVGTAEQFDDLTMLCIEYKG